jgi:hypothetical protein
MDDVKLAKLVDVIVKQRLQEILKNNKSIQRLIREEVKSQLIGILLENKIDLSSAKVKKTSQISELLNDNRVQRKYPKIERKEQPQVVERSFVKDPVLNQILNATPYVADSGGGFTGNALMDSMGMGESMMYAQSVASGLGKNVKIDIDQNAVNNVSRNIIPNNAQFITDSKTPHLKEYVGDDGFKYVDDRMLFENDHSPAQVVHNTMGSVNLERALNKNYKQLLGKMDEKAQRIRNKPLNRIN